MALGQVLEILIDDIVNGRDSSVVREFDIPADTDNVQILDAENRIVCATLHSESSESLRIAICLDWREGPLVFVDLGIQVNVSDSFLTSTFCVH